jgi:hypothetical protein
MSNLIKSILSEILWQILEINRLIAAHQKNIVAGINGHISVASDIFRAGGDILPKGIIFQAIIRLGLEADRLFGGKVCFAGRTSDEGKGTDGLDVDWVQSRKTEQHG